MKQRLTFPIDNPDFAKENFVQGWNEIIGTSLKEYVERQKYVAKAEITINASSSSVWKALTTPELVKQYLFGTNVTTDWKQGSSITYTGEWEGKSYEDKGVILKTVPEKILVTTYWSSFSGLPDLPENYKRVIYELFPEGKSTRLVITQDNNKTAEEAAHSEENWNMVLGKLKELLEK